MNRAAMSSGNKAARHGGKTLLCAVSARAVIFAVAQLGVWKQKVATMSSFTCWVVALGIYDTTEKATDGLVIAISVLMILQHAPLLEISATTPPILSSHLKQTRATWALALRFPDLHPEGLARLSQSLSDIHTLHSGMC